MKLLYVTADRFPPFRADVVELFGRQLPARGHQVDWLMQRGADATAEKSPVVWIGNRVHLTPRLAGNGFVVRVLNNVLGFAGDLMILPLAMRGKYDVIQVRDKFFAGIIAWMAARVTGAKFVHWMSYPYAESKLYQAANRLVPHHRLVWIKGHAIRFVLYHLVLPLADHVFVQSQRMKEDVEREGVRGSKMTPVPMGIRADQVRKNEAARAPSSEAPLLLYLGIILRLRQTEMLVRVLAKVREKYPLARLRYVGEGQMETDRKAVEQEAARLGLEDAVEITGFLPMAEAWRHVEEADICFSPFFPIPVLLSTSPTKIIEYMAMSKCVVANEHPEQLQIMRDSGVGRCVAWDEQAFADEVTRLLDNPLAAAEAAAKGPGWVSKHRTYDVIADSVERRFEEILQEE